MTKILFLLIAVASHVDDPMSYAVTEHVDLIEVNHYFDEGGKSVFDQLIFYNWDTRANRFNVTAWRLIKSDSQLPLHQAGGSQYYCAWYDGKTLRLVTADRVFESWTQYDPEAMERSHLAKEQRADLIKLGPKD